MLSRLLLWLVFGLALGRLATAAGLAPAAWGSRRWLVAPALGAALGAIVALVGGLLASIILDDIFATYAAILLPIVAFGVVWAVSGRRRAGVDSRP